ncbi:MAG: sulfur oxidation c-type cytochrome SoxX [Burkholderiaceae bacterium]|jgi:sulfur-oxidizing protein SoxX|nr:sulfur oxidation c-type cytochrome SoxX [Burkholderiaceae bacterium]
MTVRLAAVILSALLAVALVPAAQAQGLNYEVVGDGIPKPLTSAPGNAARGKALLAKREAANCLKCHQISQKELAGGGNKGPSLDGIGANLTPAQIRLSVVDLSRVSKKTDMPSFHKSGGEAPKLNAQEVEDVVAFLGTLRR